MKENTSKVLLYVVKSTDGYFAGFNAEKNSAVFVDEVKFAKKFSNKNNIKLRPHEMIVELEIDLAKVEFTLSKPFRPQRKAASQTYGHISSNE